MLTVFAMCLVAALGGGLYVRLLLRARRLPAAPTKTAVVLTPARGTGPLVSRALLRHLRLVQRQTKTLRGVRFEVRTKSGVSATIIQAIAAEAAKLDPGTSFRKAEVFTLREAARRAERARAPEPAPPPTPEELAKANEEALPFVPQSAQPADKPSSPVTCGKVLESTSWVYISNHGHLPFKVARMIPRIVRKFPMELDCTMRLEF